MTQGLRLVDVPKPSPIDDPNHIPVDLLESGSHPFTPPFDERLHVETVDNSNNLMLSFYRFSIQTKKLRTARRPVHQWVRYLGGKSSPSAYPMTKYVITPSDILFREIRECWPSHQVTYDDDAGVCARMWAIIGAGMNANQKDHVRFHECDDITTLPVREGSPLDGYQELALRCSKRVVGYPLFMEQGTGKTAIVVRRVVEDSQDKRDRGESIYTTLIVVPGTLKRNWENEFAKFDPERGGIAEALRGSKIERFQAMTTLFKRATAEKSRYIACIVTYDLLQNDWDVLGNIPWDLAVLDESHYVKSERTKRWRVVRDLRNNSSSRMALTGTPIGNTVLDLYTQLEFLYPGLSYASTFKEFKEKFAHIQPMGGGFEKVDGMVNTEFLKRWLNRVAFITTKRKVLPSLPPKVYDTDDVEMTSKQNEIYRQLSTQLLVQIEEELDSGRIPKQLEVTHVLTRLLRLAQVTSGYIKWDPEILVEETEFGHEVDDDFQRPEGIIESLVPNPKLDRLLEILLEKEPHQKTIVWSCWVHDIVTITEALKENGIKCAAFYGGVKQAKRDLIVESFNSEADDSIRVFVGNPATGGVGLNLLGHPGVENPRTYCDHMIYFACNWSYLQRAQSEDRAHRRGTQNHVQVTDLIIANSIDEEIRLRVQQKKLLHLELTDVRSILRSLQMR